MNNINKKRKHNTSESTNKKPRRSNTNYDIDYSYLDDDDNISDDSEYIDDETHDYLSESSITSDSDSDSSDDTTNTLDIECSPTNEIIELLDTTKKNEDITNIEKKMILNNNEEEYTNKILVEHWNNVSGDDGNIDEYKRGEGYKEYNEDEYDVEDEGDEEDECDEEDGEYQGDEEDECGQEEEVDNIPYQQILQQLFQTSSNQPFGIIMQLTQPNSVSYTHDEEDQSEQDEEKQETIIENEIMIDDNVQQRSQKRQENMKLRNEKANKRKKDEENKQAKKKNTDKYHKLLHDNKQFDDKVYFQKLSLEEQTTLIDTLQSTKNLQQLDVPYRIKLLKLDIPNKYKSIVLRKIQTLESSTHENTKLRNWIDQFMQIPFGVYKNLPVSIHDGPQKCNTFIDNAKSILDETVYGMEDIKLQILQVIGQIIANPNSIGTSIALKGPMGTGKTTLVKEGISKILQRPFTFIALGGATESSFLEGHSYTWEGSTCGQIVNVLKNSKCMNPVIYFDELDKVSNTPRGDEIIGILTHLTDPTQNSHFQDKYFAEVPLNLDKCLFIFSYNDESKINPILRDRMYRISTRAYTMDEKLNIANRFLLPPIQKNISFNKDDIHIEDDIMRHIVDKFTEGEEGVRNLKRCLETIYKNINLRRFVQCNKSKDHIVLPLYITKSHTEEILQKDDPNNNRVKVVQSEMPDEYKKLALQKITRLETIDSSYPEYTKLKEWIDGFVNIPFNVYRELPVTLQNGLTVCEKYMLNAKKILDETVYGLEDAKIQIMQYLAQLMINPSSVGTSIAIKGPMGTGKTSLIKNGISRILERPFEFIALGGANDGSYFEGHSYTYTGSKSGEVVNILRRSKCMNPIIYFDELDKISETTKGDEITNILMHLTDTTQNSNFHDKYFDGIQFNLNKCLFIFSYNNEKKINPILLDRMYKIKTNGYSTNDKIEIAKNYLIPVIQDCMKFEDGQVTIEEKTFQSIIEHHTNNERGVRNLKRCLEIIYSKLNMYRFLSPNTTLYKEDKFILEFPFTVSNDNIHLFLTKNEEQFYLQRMMYT